MRNDMLGFCMANIAANDLSKGLHTFTAAQLSSELLRMAKIENTVIDGQVIRTILCGREDVVVLGSGYYGLKLK